MSSIRESDGAATYRWWLTNTSDLVYRIPLDAARRAARSSGYSFYDLDVKQGGRWSRRVRRSDLRNAQVEWTPLHPGEELPLFSVSFLPGEPRWEGMRLAFSYEGPLGPQTAQMEWHR